MSWIRESKSKSWLQNWCENTLKCGPIPKHIAIIMDGNRRFAQKNNFDRAKGHLMGFDKLAETLEWCLDLGVTEVTVYAFSIENFKRSKEEVECLMELAREKFARLMQEKDTLEKHGVCIRVLGNVELLPLDLQQMIAEAVLLTKHNSRASLNVAFSYTSRDEMCCAMREVIDGVQLGYLKQSDISESLLEKCFYSSESPDPDLLVRTSGEVRLSDFLLWQSSYSVLSFMRVLWPEFSVWHLYACVLHYQINYPKVHEAKLCNSKEREKQEVESDRACAIAEISQKKPNGLVRDQAYIEQQVTLYTVQRKERIRTFLEYLKTKRQDRLLELCPQYSSLQS